VHGCDCSPHSRARQLFEGRSSGNGRWSVDQRSVDQWNVDQRNIDQRNECGVSLFIFFVFGHGRSAGRVGWFGYWQRQRRQWR
jgi:hypothetical protein